MSEVRRSNESLFGGSVGVDIGVVVGIAMALESLVCHLTDFLA